MLLILYAVCYILYTIHVIYIYIYIYRYRYMYNSTEEKVKREVQNI